MMNKKIGAAAVIVAAFLLIAAPCSAKNKKVEYFYYDDISMWDHIYQNSSSYVIPEKMPASVVIPHHDITAAQQNSFYKALSKQGKPSVVVLISPDHFEFGKKLITLPKGAEFDSPKGTLTLAKEVESRLCKNKDLKKYIDVSSAPWTGEHGVYVHTPFIGKYFPGTKFLPILLKSFSKDDEFAVYEKLAQVLAEILPEDALVIASVDFSHYQIPRMTALHDFVTMNTIQSGEDLKHVEVDSPESLTVAIGFARSRGFSEPVLIDRTSTYDFIPDEMVVSTSHQYWAFYKNDEALLENYRQRVQQTKQRYSHADYSLKNQTLLIGGSGNTGAGIRSMWDWDRYYKSKDPAERLFHDFAGTEARFLEGFDALIFELASGSTYSSHLHGTGLFIKAVDLEEVSLEPERAKDELTFGFNQINILMVNGGDSSLDYTVWMKANGGLLEKLLSQYELVVLKGGNASTDSFVCLKQEEKTVAYNMGVLYDCNGGPIKGNVFCVNWYNGTREIQVFEYSSENGIPPAINQGEDFDF